MKLNLATWDRVARLAVAALLFVLYFTQTITGAWGIVALSVAGIFTLTAFLRFCPIYWACRISTLKTNKS